MDYKKLLYATITAIIGLGFVVAFLLMPYSCEDNNKPKPVINIQTIINDELLKLDIKNAKKDSAINARNIQMRKDSVNLVIQVTKYKNAYYKAIKTAPDTCKSYIDTIYKECNKVDSIRLKYSLKQDSTIKDLTAQKENLKIAVTKKDLIIGIKNDSLNLMQYNCDKLNKKIRNNLIKSGGACLLSFFIGKAF